MEKTHINNGKVSPCRATKRACTFKPATPASSTLAGFKNYNEYESYRNNEDKTLGYRSPLFFFGFDEKVELLAGIFHQQWRHDRLRKDGTYEPRVKNTKDEKWIAKHHTTEVDIANTSYSDLPADWQEENKQAAQFIVREFVDKEHVITMYDNKAVAEVGDKIHKAWLSRNSWAKNGELDVPFSKLPKDEQDKDIAQYRVALISFFGD